MIDRIIKCLKENKDLTAWKIDSKKTESSEFFFVSTNLETNRATNTSDILVTVYVDKEDKRGSSSFFVDPYFTEEDISAKIKETVFAAGLALNAFFELPFPSKEKILKNESNLEGKNFNELVDIIAPAVFRTLQGKEGTINATEIFLYKFTNRIINSNGIDVSFASYKGNIEIIPSWAKDGKDVEVYNMLEFSSLDTKSITNEVEQALQEALDRCNAETIKLPQVNVILRAEDIARMCDFFISDLSYGSKYQKISKFEVGQSVQGDDVKGDKLSIALLPMLSSSANSSPVDSDGVVLKEIELIKDGVAQSRHGSYRFGYYLKEKNPTGLISNVKVGLGNKSEEEIRKEPYIECVRFSSLQLNQYNGFFGGEVRLAYYFDGEKKIPVTGLSISGNLEDMKKHLVFSNEEVKVKRYQGPSICQIKGIKVA